VTVEGKNAEEKKGKKTTWYNINRAGEHDRNENKTNHEKLRNVRGKSGRTGGGDTAWSFRDRAGSGSEEYDSEKDS